MPKLGAARIGTGKLGDSSSTEGEMVESHTVHLTGDGDIVTPATAIHDIGATATPVFDITTTATPVFDIGRTQTGVSDPAREALALIFQ